MKFNIMYDHGEKILTGIHPSEGKYCPNNLYLPEGITQIGEGAFADCPVQYVFIPNGVKNINYAAFQDCTSLLDITIPDSVEGIDEEAFRGCTKLKTINWGKNLKFIGRNAFAKCKSLKGPMIMPQNLTTIGARVFAGTGVTAITLGAKAKDISPAAFRGHRGNSKIKEIIISPKNPNYYVNNNWIVTKKTKILIGAAGDKANKIPTDIKGIGIDACAGLPIKKVEFNKVKIIGGGAFENCDQLTTIRISKNVEEIRGEAFADCENLEAIEIEEKSKLKEIGMKAFSGCHKLIPPKFDEKKVKIGPYAFAFCGEEKRKDILGEIITRWMALTDEEKKSIILERFK